MTAQNAVENGLNPIIEAVQNRINDNDIDVPLLPEVANKVMRLTQDPDSDSAQLAQLIQSDQTLAGHVMRVANSAAYSPNASMVSLQQAITRLGMRVISEIALAASINSQLFNTPGYEKHIEYILKCSLASGLWAKETARACRKNVEAAFLAGLLNDIGRPVAVQTALEIATKQNISLNKEEMLHIESQTKRDIGMCVLNVWEMPAAVKNVVEYFDRYREEHPGKLQTMIVVAGTAISNHFFCDEDEEYCPSREELLANPVFGEINLYPDEVEQLLEQEDAVKSSVEAMGL